MSLDGRVVASYGRQVLVEDTARKRYRCVMRGRRLQPVCADQVHWRHQQGEGADGIVTAILPRRNALERPDSRGRIDILAANLTQLVVVVAPRPEADLGLVDRYLAAAELMEVKAALVSNKQDIGPVDLAEYSALDYTVLEVCAKRPDSLSTLAQQLHGHTSILVGQSGVGKSSLLNALIPGLEARTRDVSAGSGEGRHTTTASELHHLPAGGEVIDSPGVRDYAPPPVPAAELQAGFREIAAAPPCRFHNCRHLREPECAVKAGVAAGQISRRRYESYCQLLQRLQSLGDDYS